MPELARFSGCRLTIHPGDHLPPHFHLLGPGWALMVAIGDLSPLKGKGPRGDVEEALAWARRPEHRARLEAEWRRLNERD